MIVIGVLWKMLLANKTMKLTQITFTRFIAAISIVIFHYGKDVFPFNFSSLLSFFKQADIGVSYFFLLSGFIMIIAYSKEKEINVLHYYQKRLARIYPIYFLAIIATFVYFVFIDKYINWPSLFISLLLLQAWLPGHATELNAAAWTLVIELFFYSIFPLLYNKIYQKVNYKKLILPIIALWLVSQIFLNWFLYSKFYTGFPSNSHEFIFYFPLLHLNEFLLGNLAGLWFVKKLINKQKNYDFYILILTILLYLAILYPFNLNYHNGLLAIIFVPLILLISLTTGLIKKIFNHKSLIFLGDISYGVYILQIPIFLFTRKIMSHFAINNNTLNFYIPLFVLLILSGLSYHYLETPLRKYISNLKLKRTRNNSNLEVL